MNDLVASPFGTVQKPTGGGGLVEVESQRAIAETQAAMVIAKRFPRNQAEAMDRILQAFTRPALAEAAQYEYSRGGSAIVGPSIRSAETIAQEWGNLQFGIRELTQANGESEVEAFAWDVERNTKQVKVFRVPHKRHTKQGSYDLKDPRDVYELVANQGARRLRACILGIIPGDVVEAAMKQAELTMKADVEITPELIKGMLDKFAEYGVTRDMIEKKIQRNIDAISPAAVVNLRRIFNSMKDGMGSAADYFEVTSSQEPPAKGAEGLKQAMKSQQKPSGDAPAPDAQDEALKEVEKRDQKKPLTFAAVSEQINKAKSAADLDAIELDRVKDEKQREELKAMIGVRRGELGQV